MATAQGLPRETFAKLSPHPYLLATLRGQGPSSAPSRVNNRAPQQARAPEVNTATLTHAHGSALVRVGGNTAVCGVRGEILPVANIPNYRAANRDDPNACELRDYDLLVPNIELATGSSAAFLPGAPPTTLAQTLTTRVFSLLHTSNLVNVDDLRIWHTPPAEELSDGEDDAMEDDTEEEQKGTKEVIGYWVLYIDIFFMAYDGNPFDVAWAALLAALRHTKLPSTRWDPDRELVICSRQDRSPLRLNGFPIACTAGVFEERSKEFGAQGEFYTLIDPDAKEEELCDESVTVVVDKSAGKGKTKVLSVSKHGGTMLQPELLREYIGIAGHRWDEYKAVME